MPQFLQIICKILLSAGVIYAAFYGVRLIWKSEVDFTVWFKAPSKALPVREIIEPPGIITTITTLPSNYKPGLEVHGLQWKASYHEYMIVIKPIEPLGEITDLQIRFNLPAPMVYRALGSWTKNFYFRVYKECHV